MINPALPSPDPRASREALVHFGTAFAFLLLGGAALVWNSGRLASGDIADPRVIGGLHWITLGWLSLSILGALRVFSGVALGTEGMPGGLVGWIRRLWTAGAAVFPLGLLLGEARLIITGASLLSLAILLFTILLVPALARATRGGLTRAYLAIALASLWATLLLGLGAALLRAGTPLWVPPPGYFPAHVLVAVFGWVGATIVGVGSHLIPMFALSRTSVRWPVRAALPLWALVPVLGAAGAFMPEPFLRAGWAAAGAGSTLWIIQVAIYFRTRLRRDRDPGLLLAGGATALMGAAWVSALAFDAPIAFVGTLIVGWLTLFTLEIFHRIVPFLAWFSRFAARPAGAEAPRVKDLVDERRAGLTAMIALAGAGLWGGALLARSGTAAYAGSSMILLAIALTASQIPRLLQLPERRKPRVKITGESVLERLTTVIDPEVGLNIVEMGLVYDVLIDDGNITVEMTLTTPGCPMGSYLTGAVKGAAGSIDGVTDVNVRLVWAPPWSPSKINPGALQRLQSGQT